jgi:cysteine desulfurase
MVAYAKSRSMGVYLDNFASTPIAPEALRAMNEVLGAQANPGSPHLAGELASASVETARAQIARLIGCDSSELIFTSGATESNNIALIGVAEAARAAGSSRRGIVISAIEHKAVLEPAKFLAANGFKVSICPVNAGGRIDLGVLRAFVNPETLIVSVMAANNEIGVVEPIAAIAEIVHGAGALIHTDAAQSVGRIPFDVMALDVDYVSLSAHKMHGPQGIGALFVSSDAIVPLPLVHGGNQEGGVRSGTLPTALIAGFGKAAELSREKMTSNHEAVESLASLFIEELERRQVRYERIINHPDRLPGSLALRFCGVNAEELSQMLGRDVFFTTGSACTHGQLTPSHVLQAIGVPVEVAPECARIMFSRYNTVADASIAADQLAAAYLKLRLATGGGHQ